MNYFTYLYKDPKSDVYRYVGQGKGNRAFVHKSTKRNTQLSSLLKKRSSEGYDIHPFLIQAESEKDAKEMECLLIEMIGREDLGLGPLFNHTNGGDGTSGYKHTDETRSAISSTSKKCWQDESYRRKVCGGVKKTNSDPENKRLFTKFAGSKHTQESIDKIRNSKLGKPLSLSHRKSISKKLTGTHLSDERKLNLSKKLTGTNISSRYKYWTIVDPNKNVHKVECVSIFCVENGISLSGLQKSFKMGSPVSRGPSKGWLVLEKIEK